ncbi:DUF4325 domain-containing protein [Chitinophaga horti]|uniref:DUF4325 domain-containing protein n=1 Tax=Chitinophaga horti TaxID=2920382 RepID=A0ABY6J8D6_9BACT|nr:DUF4325 domain-containing protein [Chitinophaga horti]UYQ95929.1 DUF4325 domain-containing protein [Chitinophaga horti]
MIDYHIVKYDSYRNAIYFPTRVASGLLPDFAAAIETWRLRRRPYPLRLDFSQVTKAFANGMLGVIAITAELRRQGVKLEIVMPHHKDASRFFHTCGWAHLLNPSSNNGFKPNRKHYVQPFDTFQEIPTVTANFMDIIMGHIHMPKDVLAALEWSITEICDNVVNHAESKIGGYLQVIAYPQNGLVAFTVADAGKGILQSLKEGLPNLTSDIDAIREAIKAGVTRNKDAGQGNGLAGSCRIALMTGGSLDILSGSGRLLLRADSLSQPNEYLSRQNYQGTCISGQIKMSHTFSVLDALSFGGKSFMPSTVVDLNYEREEEEALDIRITERLEGAGTRSAGKELRLLLQNLLNAKPGFPIYLDWTGVTIIASSFADEFLGKLYVELGERVFDASIRHTKMAQIVEHIIKKAISERLSTG